MESENNGQGGSYLLNPKTGKKTLLQRTLPASPHQSLPEDLNDEPENTETPVKGKN
jgi:hypothetical protein